MTRPARWLFGLAASAAAVFVHLLPAPQAPLKAAPVGAPVAREVAERAEPPRPVLATDDWPLVSAGRAARAPAAPPWLVGAPAPPPVPAVGPAAAGARPGDPRPGSLRDGPLAPPLQPRAPAPAVTGAVVVR